MARGWTGSESPGVWIFCVDFLSTGTSGYDPLSGGTLTHILKEVTLAF